MSASTRPPHPTTDVCERDEMCVHDTDGHRMNPVRLRLALATPSGWRDGIVVGTDEHGVHVALLADDTTAVLWHHVDLALAPGEPVAVHARYGVLAAGGTHRSVAR